MAVDATLCSGSRLYYSTDSGSNYTELTDLRSMGPPGDPEAPKVDVTPLNPTSNTREKRIGLFDSGMFSFKQYYNKTRYSALRTLFTNRTLVRWKITMPEGSTNVYDGYLSKCTSSDMGNPDDPLMIDCQVEITGAVTFTAA